MEYIGKVAMDDSLYPGEDLYCDGAVEDELLAIAKDMSPIEFEKEIERRASWPVLYHLSAKRENIVDWIPFQKNQKVLEVGSGCGAITGALSRKAGSVTCVDLSKKRSMINAYRHSECDNITIHLGNFKDIEPTLDRDFDYVLLIGVFEYGQAYIGGETPYEDFLRLLQSHVAEGGRIVIAIENKYGMKYFAGCREDHLGSFFSGIEDYPRGGVARTFGRPGLEQIFKSCGVEKYQFYYPYPDYKFMTHIYSDRYLPGQGELFNNYRNFDRDRMLLFDETKAFNGVLKEGLFPVFSNSYLVVLGDDLPVVYSKFSNDRATEYAICTQMVREEDGSLYVRKYPAAPEAKEHIRELARAYTQLSERYAGSEISVNKLTLTDNDEECYAQLEYITGRPLTELFDDCLQHKDEEGFFELFHTFRKRIAYNAGVEASDYDLIFSNILVQEDGTWVIIDYEWTFGEILPEKQLSYRAVYTYLLEDEKRNTIPWDRIMEDLQITPEEEKELRQKELDFQSYVNGGMASMVEMRNRIGRKMYQPVQWFDEMGDREEVNRVQIYENCGKGFSEEASYFVEDGYRTDSQVEFTIKVSPLVTKLRIDPSQTSCGVRILELTLNGRRLPVTSPFCMLTNGRLFSRKKDGKGRRQPVFLFEKPDPQMHLNLKKYLTQGENILYAKFQVFRIPEADK